MIHNQSAVERMLAYTQSEEYAEEVAERRRAVIARSKARWARAQQNRSKR